MISRALRAIAGWRRPSAATPPTHALDSAIEEGAARYAKLRHGLTVLLYLDAKVKAETGPRSPERAALRRRLRTVTNEMTHTRAELDALRRSRLDAVVDLTLLEAG